MFESNLPAFGIQPALPRRAFLRVSGASAATVALVLAGCGSDSTPDTPAPTNVIALPAGDPGVINYLYLLEQLEEALYTRIVATPPADFSAADTAYFTDLRDHEIVHRETFRYALGPNGLPILPFDFSSLTLGTRAGALAAARQFEDLGVAAYAGAVPLLTDASLRQLTAKIMSVEARHAALVRDLLVPGSFAGADAVADTGLAAGQNLPRTPVEVMAVVAPFVQPYTITVAKLPTA